MTGLPRPVSTDQHFLAVIAERLDVVAERVGEQNDLLRRVVEVLTDRQTEQIEPAPDEPEGPQVIELREPDPVEPTPKATRRRTARKGT